MADLAPSPTRPVCSFATSLTSIGSFDGSTFTLRVTNLLRRLHAMQCWLGASDFIDSGIAAGIWLWRLTSRYGDHYKTQVAPFGRQALIVSALLANLTARNFSYGGRSCQQSKQQEVAGIRGSSTLLISSSTHDSQTQHPPLALSSTLIPIPNQHRTQKQIDNISPPPP